MRAVHQQSGTRRQAHTSSWWSTTTWPVAKRSATYSPTRGTSCSTPRTEPRRGSFSVAVGAPEPNAIVLDVQMPRMSGPELVMALRQDGRLAQIRVILASAGPRRAITDGDAELAWLPKPFDADRLLALVHEACDAEPRRAENGSE